MSEEKIVNKIVPIETIIDVANYLEDQKEEYRKLFERDENKNRNLKYNEQVYEYKGNVPKVQYTIKYKDGKDITENDYNWFIANINNLSSIELITINYDVNYSSNVKDIDYFEYMSLYTWVHFREDTITLQVDGTNMEEQVHKLHSYIRGTIEDNEERYNKTIKNRQIRIQSFCLSIGLILSYIIYFILKVNMNKLPNEITNYITNKYVLIFGQWFVAFLIGNIFGLPIMKILYKTLIPRGKYSHYNTSTHKSVYVDDVESFISENEVQIGKNANNGKKRAIIEKIYKVTKIVVLIQIVLSVLFFILFK